VINFKEENVMEIIHKHTSGRGVDGVLEAVGNIQAAKLALEILRIGGIMSVVGVHAGDSIPISPSEAYDKSLTYRGEEPKEKGLYFLTVLE